MLPYFLISVGQLVFWLRYIYDIKGGRDGWWGGSQGAGNGETWHFPMQCNTVLMEMCTMIQHFFGHFFGGVGIVQWETS